MPFIPDNTETGAKFTPEANSRKHAPSFVPDDQPSALESFGGHAGNAATFGYAPQIAGGITKALSPSQASLSDFLRPDLQNKPSKGLNPESYDPYLTGRDTANQELSSESQAHPAASLAGTVSGALGSAGLIPGGVVGKADGSWGKVFQAAGIGATAGGLSNPGDTEGQYSGVQPRRRAFNASIGAGTGAAISGASSVVQNAARRADVMDLVKNPVALQEAVEGKISDAQAGYTAKTITPSSVEQKQVMSNKTVPVNPDELFNNLQRVQDSANDPGIKASLQNHINDLSERSRTIRANSSQYSPSMPDKIEIPGEQYLDMMKSVNDASNFHQRMSYNDPTAVAKNQEALQVGNAMRAQLQDVSPETAALRNQQHGDYNLENTVFGIRGKAPISTIEASPASDKDAYLRAYDQGAGSNLSQFGRDITKAKNRLGQDTSGVPTSKTSLAKLLLGTVPRVGGAAAQLVPEAVTSSAQSPEAATALANLLSGGKR